ncbi:MAG TPA: RMD1 family protein [Panacibacter sp.]|nr:RMD1 family protein [Panacibacter sp.]HNP45094.1 RMD1 family protein [Panacibacter sp.]
MQLPNGMNLKVLSVQVADNIDLKQFKNSFPVASYFTDSDELVFEIAANKYLCVYKYGNICLTGYSDTETAALLQAIKPFCKNFLEQQPGDEFEIETGSNTINYGFNKIEIPKADIEVLRLIMLNVSHSVALDYYSEQTNVLLEETNYHTQLLEKKGRIGMSGIKLKRYIGRTLNLKNKISANLYIFDSPEQTWENETLNKLDIGLKNTFDLQSRFRTIQDGLQIVKENLDLFKDLLQYRNSSVLEWIVIVLILVEVINLLIDKFNLF